MVLSKTGVSLRWQYFLLKKLSSMKNQFYIYPTQSSCIFSSSPTNSDVTFYVMFMSALSIYTISISIIQIFQEGVRLVESNQQICQFCYERFFFLKKGIENLLYLISFCPRVAFHNETSHVFCSAKQLFCCVF